MQEETPEQPQMAAFSSIPEENLTKEQKIAKQNLEAAFGAIKQVRMQKKIERIIFSNRHLPKYMMA